MCFDKEERRFSCSIENIGWSISNDVDRKVLVLFDVGVRYVGNVVFEDEGVYWGLNGVVEI